jgi:hypothetical protein
MTFTLDVGKMRDAFVRLRDESRHTCERTTYEHMRDVVYPQTQVEVPKDTGALRDTGVLKRGDKTDSWQIKYGDSPVEDDHAVDYAKAVHEIYEHRHEPPTKVKFVEDPLKNSKDKFKELAAKKLDELAQG